MIIIINKLFHAILAGVATTDTPMGRDGLYVILVLYIGVYTLNGILDYRYILYS